MASAFSLPSTVLVGRVMPKKAFYEHLKATAVVKEEFVHLIERIELVASIKEASVHISAGEVEEIDVLSLYLREAEWDCGEPAMPRKAINLVARSVPNKLVFACLVQSRCKLCVKRGSLRETAWASASEIALELRGVTLDEVWDSLCSQVVFGSADPADFEGRLARADELEALQAQLGKAQRRRAAEKQIKKRNALWDEIKDLENRIAELEVR